MIHFEDLGKISVYDLLKADCIIPGTIKETTISLAPSPNGPAEITVHTNTKHIQPFITISHVVGAVVEKGTINLVNGPLIQNTVQWYFICPVTGIRCRKLYYWECCFQHRKAIDGIYRKQTLSRSTRKVVNQFENVLAMDKMLKKAIAPYFRPTYAGAPTRQYKKIISKINAAGNTATMTDQGT